MDVWAFGVREGAQAGRQTNTRTRIIQELQEYT